jgi:hypothetical protein
MKNPDWIVRIYFLFLFLFFPFSTSFLVGSISLSGFFFIRIVLSIAISGFDLSAALTVTFSSVKSAGMMSSLLPLQRETIKMLQG